MSTQDEMNRGDEHPEAPPGADAQGESAQEFAPDEMRKDRARRTPAERAYDLRLIENWYVQGATVAAIIQRMQDARGYTLSRTMVFKELTRLRKQWEAEALDVYDDEMQRTLRSLRKQEDELWQAWERSKQDATKQSASQESGARDGDAVAIGGKQRKAVVKESQNGDPAYMRLILEVHDKRAELLGLYKAKRQEITGANGGPIDISATVSEVDLPGTMTAEEAKKLMLRHYERITGKQTANPDISGSNVGNGEREIEDGGGVADSANGGDDNGKAV